MAFKPKDYYIGVVTFFAAMLPGAALIAFSENFWKENIWPNFSLLTNNVQYMVFLFSSLVLGLFVYLIGSLLDLIYNPLVKQLPKSMQELFNKADSYKSKESGIGTTYKWAKDVIEAKNDKAITYILLQEAFSKMFRSVFIVLIVLGFIHWTTQPMKLGYFLHLDVCV